MADGLKRARAAARATRAKKGNNRAEGTVSECGYCHERITMLGGIWTAVDSLTQIACTDLSAPFIPHNPKEG